MEQNNSAGVDVAYLDLDVSSKQQDTTPEKKDDPEADFKLVTELYKQDPTDLLSNAEFIAALNRIRLLSSSSKSNLSSSWAIKYNLAPVMAKCLQDSHSILKAESERDPEAKITSDMDVLVAPRCCISSIRNYTNRSVKFCQQFINQNGVDLLLKYLKTESLVNAFIASSKETKTSTILSNIVRGSIGCLINMAKCYSENKEIWTSSSELGNKTLMSWLLLLNKRLKNVDDCELAICILIASIAEDQELTNSRTTSDFKEVVNQLASIIGAIASRLVPNSETKNRRVKVQIRENESAVSVSAITVKNTEWHLVELLNAMYKLAINDQIKQDIYGECKMSQHLKSIIMYGNSVESEYGLLLLWQLCFDQKIANEVKSDSELIERIDSIKKKIAESKNEGLEKNCDGVLWLLTHNDVIDDRELEKDSEKKEDDKHIMISYNRDSRDMCLQIKKELEGLGHKVWIDVERMHGSSLEAMAHAIEQSKCVLVCMTEKYKQSPNCRAEAEYVFQIGKPFIPLIMQKGYKPDGWLGIFLGSKIFIDFMKYEYQECIRRLKAELSNINVVSKDDDNKKPTEPTGTTPPNNNKKPEAYEWTEKRVDEWMNEKRVHALIRRNVAPCDGRLLGQMYSMLNEAPEFFYKSISANSDTDSTSIVSTKDVALFALELKHIFQK